MVGQDRGDGYTYECFEPNFVLEDKTEAEYLVLLLNEAAKEIKKEYDNLCLEERFPDGKLISKTINFNNQSITINGGYDDFDMDFPYYMTRSIKFVE